MGKRFFEMTKEELSECGKQGGRKSAEVRRSKRAMKDTLEILLSLNLKKGKAADIESIKNFADLKGKNVDVATAMLIVQLQKALKGDLQAAQFVRDTSGQKPTDNLDLNGTLGVTIIDDLGAGEDE